MRAAREPRAYRGTRVAAYTGQMNRVGPVRRPFAFLAIGCAILVAAVILLPGILV